MHVDPVEGLEGVFELLINDFKVKVSKNRWYENARSKLRKSLTEADSFATVEGNIARRLALFS